VKHMTAMTPTMTDNVTNPSITSQNKLLS
jgi:hypothetical protein